MPQSLELDVLVTVRELPSGIVYARPMAAPEFVTRAGSESEALALLHAFLARYLARVPAFQLADYVFPEAAAALDIEVVVPKADLPERIAIATPLPVPCVVVPDVDAEWVHVLPLGHTLRVGPNEDRSVKTREHVRKAAAVRSLGDEDYRSVFPAAVHRVVRERVTIERQTIDDLGARVSERQAARKHRDREQAIELLSSIGDNLMRRRIEPIIGLDERIGALGAILGGESRLSVALVGPSLVGKSAVMEGLVSQRVVPFRRPIYATSGSRLVAGQSGFGMLQERIDRVMQAAETIDAVLYFDGFGDLFAGHSGNIEDMASILRPYLAANRVRVVGELTSEQWEYHERRHVGFFACLSRVLVEPMDRAQSRAVLKARVARHIHDPKRPRLEEAAIDPLVELAERYLPYQTFPGKAVRFCEELRAIHEGEVEADGSPRVLRTSDVVQAFAIRSGIPEFLLRDDRALKLDQVQGHFTTRIIGQKAAVLAVAETLCVVKARLQPAGKPLATFLFVGPTGVGKTELAKTLATFLFGSKDRLVRFDMSEYADPWAAERLIHGTTRDEGELTRKVRQQPFSVILLDEIEKAHPAVFDLLLAVCGEGRLSDAKGRVAYFHNAILIMTSNLGTSHRRPGVGFGDEGRVTDETLVAVELGRAREAVDQHFRPEFVNRLDRIVPFHSLRPTEIAEVARVLLRSVADRPGLVQRGCGLDLSTPALDELAREGYSGPYGARALRRRFEDALVAPLARMVASLGDMAKGAGLHVTLRVAEERVVGAELAETEVDGLRFRALRSQGKALRASADHQVAIASMRRTVARCLASAPVRELEDRIEYLVADLSGSSAREQSGVVLSMAAVECSNLQGLRRGLRDPMERICSAEDLAMAAQFEGEPGDLFLEDAEAAHAEFERAFVRVVLRNEDSVTLLVRGIEHPRTLPRWLLGLVQASQAQGWNLVVHRYDDDDHQADPGWGSKVWGPPRNAAWVERELDRADAETLGKQWRAVLVGVPEAAAGLLRLEQGIHRYPVPRDADHPNEHVEVRILGEGDTWTADDLDTDAFVLPERLSRAEAAKTEAARVWAADGSVVVGSRSFPSEVAEHYWRNLDRLHFGRLAERAIAGQDE